MKPKCIGVIHKDLKQATEKIDIFGVLQQVSQMHKKVAKKAGVHIEWVVEKKPPKARIDAQNFRLMLDNLVTEAIEGTDSGESVSLGLRKVTSGLEVSVSSPKMRYTIFLPS